MRHASTAVAAIALVALGLTACSNDNVFDIAVGSCASSESFADSDPGVVAELPLIDCEEPHDLEAIATMEIDGDEHPGEDAVTAQADEFCVAEFEEFVGISYEESEFLVNYFAPTQETWDRVGDREVLCWLITPEPVTGSQAGAAR